MKLLEKAANGNIFISSILTLSQRKLYEADAEHFSEQANSYLHSPGISPSASKYELSSPFLSLMIFPSDQSCCVRVKGVALCNCLFFPCSSFSASRVRGFVIVIADRGGEFSIFQGIGIRIDIRIGNSNSIRPVTTIFGKQVHLPELGQVRLIIISKRYLPITLLIATKLRWMVAYFDGLLSINT